MIDVEIYNSAEKKFRDAKSIRLTLSMTRVRPEGSNEFLSTMRSCKIVIVLKDYQTIELSAGSVDELIDMIKKYAY